MLGVPPGDVHFGRGHLIPRGSIPYQNFYANFVPQSRIVVCIGLAHHVTFFTLFFPNMAYSGPLRDLWEAGVCEVISPH